MKKIIEKNRQLIPILILSAVGIIVSLYLTYTYFNAEDTAFCLLGDDCDIVQQSRYASILGIPVAILGVIGYLAISLTAISPMSKRKRWVVLFILIMSGTSFSIYLTYTSIFILDALCFYCLISAVLMIALAYFILSLTKAMSPRSSFGNLFFAIFFIFCTVFIVSYAIHSAGADDDLGPSDRYQTNLAKHLGEDGAVMYGSFRCPHCIDQKKMFGEAFRNIRYVECHSMGPDPNPSLCLAKGIRSYPTWEINGRFYEGLLSLDELARISGFESESR